MTIKDFLICVMFMLSVGESYGQTAWPEDGLVARWDIDKNGMTDVENGYVMELDKRYVSVTRNGSPDKHRYDTLYNGRKALGIGAYDIPLFLGWNRNIDESEKVLKKTVRQYMGKNFKYTILPDTFTIIVKYSLAKLKRNVETYNLDTTKCDYEIERLDSWLIAEKDIAASYNYDSSHIVEADDGKISIEKGWIDTTCVTRAKYDIPMVVNKNDGTVWLAYSFIPVTYDKHGSVIYMEEITTQDGIYRCYKKKLKSSLTALGSLKQLRFKVPGYVTLTDVAIYNRRMSVDEVKMLTGNGSIAEYNPGYDHTTFGMLWIVPTGVLLLIIIRLFSRAWSKKNKPYTGMGLPFQSNSRKKAMAELEQAWRVFGSRQTPLYPNTKKELNAAQLHFDLALASGCNDEDIVVQINEIGSLLNHSRSLYYYPKLPVMLSVIFISFVSLGPIFKQMLEYSLTTNEFYLYYLTIASILLCGLTPRYVSMGGKAIPKANSVMGELGRSCIDVAQGVAKGVGTSILGTIMSIIGVIAMAISIFFSCIFEYVVVCGGVVIATGVGGFFTGAMMVILFGVLLGMAIPVIYGFMISVLIAVLPVLCYFYCQIPTRKG